MGIRDVLNRIGVATALTTPVTSTLPLASPWSTTELSRIIIADLAGLETSTIIGRAAAMKVPAIVKGRALIAGQLARFPLKKYVGDREVETPPWAKASAYGDPYTRMLWTIDDLIFHGMSLWVLDRGDAGITDALRLPPSWWAIDPDTFEIKISKGVNFQPDPDQVCLFEAPQDGLLTIAADTIEGARAIDAAWVRRVKSPIPNMELHSTDPNGDLTTDEATELVATWESARANGGTAYTPASIQAIAHGKTSTELFVEGRNAIRLDVANFYNVPASMLDGSMSTASLTYSTTEGKRNEFLDYSLRYWAAPIEARLSRDDIAGYGRRVAFDFESVEVHPPQPIDTED